MASYNNSELSALGMMANSVNHWTFQGKTSFDPAYEGNFDADIDAIAESIGDDSGYFSNDTDYFEASNINLASDNDRVPPADFGHKPSLHSDTFYADVVVSNKSNHGSIYNGAQNKSTTHIEKASSASKHRVQRRMSKTLYHPVHENEHKTPHKYSMEISGSRPFALEQWANTQERHEWIAYRLEQPANLEASKRRKTSGGK